MATPSQLPIESLRSEFMARRADGPVVVSAPTGSGKSTQVPRWCVATGAVLVVEPRRVACRSLAQRVAFLEGVSLGQEVGYRVRDDNRSSKRTRILFATPGVVLRMVTTAPRLSSFAHIILDEFHERGLEVDLLLALLTARRPDGLVVMSATLDGDRVARHIGGPHLRGEGRLHEVSVSYLARDATLPSAKGLEGRLMESLRQVEAVPGDVLVFLPGKAEISAARRAVESSALGAGYEVRVLHGGLELRAQAQVFGRATSRKLVLATNVAETSLTIPGIGVVIDSGLVRRTEYFGGRGFLSLVPIAMDSATQRTGRAGRTGPGTCVRLWSMGANLASNTPPEIHRESLVSLVLGAAACGQTVESLPFIDPPKQHAVEAAGQELAALGALTAESGLNDVGRALFGLPLDAPLGRLLLGARDTPCMGPVVDLVSLLATGRRVYRPSRGSDGEGDAREEGCDVRAYLTAMASGMNRPEFNGATLDEARRIQKRLRRAFGDAASTAGPPNQWKDLALTLLRSDPRLAHVARHRRKEVTWSNGGTEAVLARESAVARLFDDPRGKKPEAIIALESRAMGLGGRKRKVIITCAMPVPLKWLGEAGLGRERVAEVIHRRGRLLARIERVHARKVLAVREECPRGDLAVEALHRAMLSGRLWPKTVALTRERLEARALQASLDRHRDPNTLMPPNVEDWLRARLVEAGVESGDDVALLDADEFLADDLPQAMREALDRIYPRRLELPDVTYRLEYDVPKRQVALVPILGSRRKPPPLQWLPKFEGFTIVLRDKRGETPLRGRR